jgi:acetyl esterase/lipase
MYSEGTLVAEYLQDYGIAAFIVKYRLPSDATMEDKTIGPLQDAQQAIRLVREHASSWKLDPARVGVLGFSAGGHLAATLGTHLDKSYISNPDGISLRPDFMMLVYPVISMDTKIAHMGSRLALLGPNPTDDKVRLFSNELQVTNKTPPTLLLQATDDHLVDVDNSIVFFEALSHHEVPVDMTIFKKGDHGLFLLPRDRWESMIPEWMQANGWMK